MAAQQGRALLLKVDADGAGNFVAVAGLRSKGLTLNAQLVDVTNADSVGAWRELLAGAGVKSARVQGQGIFKDQAVDESVRGLFFNAARRAWQVIVPDFGVIEGPFQIAALDYAGEHDGEVSFSLTLESAGALSFTPV